MKAMLMGAMNDDKGPSATTDTPGGKSDAFIRAKSRVAGDGVPTASISNATANNASAKRMNMERTSPNSFNNKG